MSAYFISPNGLAFLKREEGFVGYAYDDADPHLKPIQPGDHVIGTLTIGYGTTFYPNGAKVQPGDTITQTVAEGYAVDVVNKFFAQVRPHLTYDINQNQFDALASFIYNLGPQALISSTLLRLLNAGDISNAAQQFQLWCHDQTGNVNQALKARRGREAILFLS